MTEALRVAMVIQRFRPAFSGQGIQVEAIAKALARRGVDVTIISATSGTQRSIEVCDGYSVVRVGSDPPSFASSLGHSRLTGPMFAARTFGCLQTSARCDLVHVHAMTDALYASYAWCRLHDKPLLFEMTLVGADDPLAVAQSRHLFSSIRRTVYGRCDGYVAISPALQELSREAGLPQDRVQLVPQGVDIDRFRPVDDRMSIRRELGLPTVGPLLTFVGSLVHRKGLDVLVDAWCDVHRAHPAARLLLVGRDDFEGRDPETAFLSDQLARVPAAAAERMHRTGVRRMYTGFFRRPICSCFRRAERVSALSWSRRWPAVCRAWWLSCQESQTSSFPTDVPESSSVKAMRAVSRKRHCGS